MHTISITHLKALLMHVAVKLKHPVMVWGPPGVGKSESIHQLTAAIGGQLCDVRLSQYDSVDLRGIPVPDHERRATAWYAPLTLPFIGNDAFPDAIPIVLFLDEINAAASAVSAVAYQLINEGCVGEHRLKPNVIVIAAGNRESDRGVTNRMPLPLANRFTHVEVMADVGAWTEYAATQSVSNVGIAFLNFRKPLLMTFDPSKPDKAFATPRSWMKALTYYEADMPAHLKMAAMAGAVGEGPSAEFWGFVDVWLKLPKLERIIAEPDTLPIPEEMSARYAVAVSISGALSPDNVNPLYTYLRRMDVEYVVLAWQLAVRRNEDLFATPEYLTFAKQYKVVFSR